MTHSNTLIVYGDTQPWDQQREILLAYPITNGFAQLAIPSFLTSWTGMGDIVAYDKRRRISRIVIRNSRTFYGRFDVEGLNEIQIGRFSERLGKYLSSHSISPLFVNRFPGIFSMSSDRRISKKRIMTIVDQAPVPIEIVPPRELGTTLESAKVELISPSANCVWMTAGSLNKKLRGI